MSSAKWQLDGLICGLKSAAVEASINCTRPDLGLHLHLVNANDAPVMLLALGVTFGNAARQQQSNVDAYVRGTDLVTTFEGSAEKPLRLQAYWRLLDAAEFAPEFSADVRAAFDLIVSVNTSLLDDNPQSKVRGATFAFDSLHNLRGTNRGSSGESKLQLESCPTVSLGIAKSVDGVLNFSPAGRQTGAMLLRLQNADVSWVEMIHPSDFSHSTARPMQVENESLESLPKDVEAGVEITHDLFRQRLEKGVILRGRVRGALVSRDHDEAIALTAYRRFAAAEPPLTV
jgi:hypothetical protein